MDLDDDELIATRDGGKCKYCQEGHSISEKNRNALGIELHSGTRKIIAYGIDRFGWDISIECNIKHCPMCGRKLGD